MMKVCQIEIDGTWTKVDIEDARALYEGQRKRCPRCKGEVHAYPAHGSEASTPHFGHNIANPGCPNVKHPLPLE